MLVPNTNTRARCTGDDESAPKTRDSTRRRCLLTYLTQAALSAAARKHSREGMDVKSSARKPGSIGNRP